MKKCTFLLVPMLCLWMLASAQSTYLPGYWNDLSGHTTSCLIRFGDWKNNPVQIHYKLSESTPELQLDVNTCSEFAVTGRVKYIRAVVQVDRSSDKLHELSSSRFPDFQQQVLFLRVILEGKASLFGYSDGDRLRFFIGTEAHPIEQLVNKEYYITASEVATNDSFHIQLTRLLECNEGQISQQLEARYTEKALSALVESYNTCKGSGSVKIKRPSKPLPDFRLHLQPGGGFSSFQVKNFGAHQHDVEFSSQPAFQMGITAEFILPFWNDHWSVILEPNFQKYTGTAKTPGIMGYPSWDVKLQIQQIELPVGVRHYFPLGKSFVYIDASMLFAKPLNSKLTYSYTPYQWTVSSSVNYQVGAGWFSGRRISAAIRYKAPTDLLRSFNFWKSSYSQFLFMLGYRIR